MSAKKTIGRFEIRKELGRGAQSVVYLAWDPQLQREVAIKTMHFDESESHLNTMLLGEARTVSKLRHANVVPIFDAGEQDGDPYLVFEYVQGPTLADKIHRDGPMPPLQAVAILRQVVDALAQAHSLGIIHRDLKPSNILMDKGDIPRVMDFGIAARVDDVADTAQQGLMGTPAYLAPEYVKDKVISEQVDVYAAGLILLEMVTGHRVVAGDSAGQILYHVLNDEIKVAPGLDEKLADIALKACAKDPTLRFANAGQMGLVLDQYLSAGGIAPTEISEAKKQSTLEFLLRRMRHKSDFPALSESVSAINRLTDSDKESINKLSNTILRDFALTNKILRLVNSAYYRQAGGGNISTVSRAVIVLGFDAIRNISITVLLFEHLQDKSNARELKESFLRANLAGLLAREIGKKVGEEAFICALFHNLGQLLSQFYFPEEVETIRILVQQKKTSLAHAAAQVLGLTFEELGIGIAKSWGFPQAIPHSMRKLPEGPVRKPSSDDENLRIIAVFANEMCDLISDTESGSYPRALRAITDRFGSCLQLSEAQIRKVVEDSSDELTQVASILHVNLKQSPFARQLVEFINPNRDSSAKSSFAPKQDTMERTLAETLLGDPLGFLAEGTDDANSPDHDAEAILTAGIQDISNSLVEDVAVNDILRIILETVYRAMGFKRVLLCLKDAKTGMMTGRFGFGPDTNDVVRNFQFSVAFAPDVFHLAVSKGVDILIADIDDAKIADKIPKWYRERMVAKTFSLFPLAIKGNTVAMIYCDKDKAGDIRISEKELQLLKTLRNQAVLAIKQAS